MNEPLSSRVSPLTRRRFLAFSGVAAAGALAVGATRVRWSDLLTAAAQTPLDPAAGVLVMVTLYGGNDGLNTVVPAGDPAYASARAELAYAESDVLDLGEGLGLNPGLAGLHELWAGKELAVLRGVGYPDPDRSHFRSMAIWQTASPQTAATTGWLGRWLDAGGDDPLRAVSLDALIPPMLAGAKTAAASFPVSGLRLPKDALGRSMALLGGAAASDGVWQARVAKSVADLQQAARVLGPAAGGTAGPTNSPVPSPSAGGADADPDEQSKGASAGGQGELAAQLETVASLIELGVPTRVYSVSLGGFDTHSDERATQQRLLTELDGALSGFYRRLQGSDRGRQVVTAVYSEFGRRVRANSGDGTDHGTAGPMFVLGRGVSGGFYGAEPSLTDLDDGDLKAGLDFRSVYATLLAQVLGSEPEPLLGGWDRRVDGLLS
ncbi:DUF1501 domain-containing protein [Microlunatus ginsengisoli]|uniref:DUF1501 domain-containing protein n=2 Tax=Microlunatus ginsengisoli TaxID=363863 RepID=A0ABP7ATJ1_9ACTN